jgi:hypothetical protein
MPNDILTEARARIIWGDEPESVREFLISKGVSASSADDKIRELSAERYSEIRKIGIWNTLSGVALVGGAAALIYFSFKYPYFDIAFHHGRGFAGVVIAGFYGLWKLVNGIIYLVRPQCEYKSISDIPV